MKIYCMVIWLTVKYDSNDEIFMCKCTKSIITSVFRIWSMTPIELAHTVEERTDRSR